MKQPPRPKKTAPKATHAGFVAILGAPNAGKSTLLNHLIGQKISIVSPKPQTTRMRTLGVLTEGDMQRTFVDTPGIFAPKRRLDEAMVNVAWQSLADADAVMLMVDASVKQPDEKTEAIIEALKAKQQRVILALNKVDAVDKARLLPIAEKLNDSGAFSEIFMISALTGDGVADLKTHLKKLMPESPWFFEEDQLSDLPSRLIAAEATREQLFRQLQQELPYGLAVIPESWEEKKDGSVVIRQKILVARESHKPMVLGAGGSRIKSIGAAARMEIEKMLGLKAHLFLEVKVDEKWQDRVEIYQMFGLEE